MKTGIKIKNKKDFENLFKSKEDYISTYLEVTNSMKIPVEFLGNIGIKTFYKQLNKLLSKSRNTILVTHDVPYDTTLDKVNLRGSPVYGEHIGDEI